MKRLLRTRLRWRPQENPHDSDLVITEGLVLAVRIAFTIINANRREGTSRAVLEVAERLALDHHVDLFARTVEDADLDKLNWVRVGGLSRPEVGDFASFKWIVDRKISKMSYDIIHSPGPNTAWADVYAIQTVHPVKMAQIESMRSESSVGWPRRICWKAYDQQVVAAERQSYTRIGPRGPRAFLPVSSGTKRELLQEYPDVQVNDVDSSEDNVPVIPNGADLNRFHPRNRQLHRADVRKEHGLDERDFVLLFSGGDWRRKGLDLAIEALARIQDARVKILVVGHDRAGADVKGLVTKLGLSSRVRFAGFRHDVHRYYATGDLFLFPTAYEAFSLATIEAAAAGLPVLMPDVSGAKELIGSGQAGTLIERNPDHIASIIDLYRSNPARVAAAGKAGRTLVEKQFSWDSITDRTLNIYKQVIQRREAMNPGIPESPKAQSAS